MGEHRWLFNDHIIFCTGCKTVVTFVNPAYDVERKDCHYLRKAIKEAAKNRKREPCMLMKTLYLHTYVCVADILEKHGAQNIRKILTTAQTAIRIGLTEGDEGSLDTALTVAQVLNVLPVSVQWDNTDLLEEIVSCLPEEARKLASNILSNYNLYLDVYHDVVTVRDSLAKDVTAPEAPEAQIGVEVTVGKDLSEFTSKDCKEMLHLLLCNSWKIPRNKIMVAEARTGSTTVIFLIDKAYMENIIKYSVESSTLWTFQELSVTWVRSGVFELNVVQLLSQHFKAALRSGLTSDMDFVGAIKVCGVVINC